MASTANKLRQQASRVRNAGMKGLKGIAVRKRSIRPKVMHGPAYRKLRIKA